MPVKINGATSGSTTITAPATGGDESIELSTALAAKADLDGATYTGTHDFTGATVTGAGSLNLTKTQTFSAASAVSLNDCFSADYQNYRIVFAANKSTSSVIYVRFRASGSDITASNYYHTRVFFTPSSASGDNPAAQTSMQIDNTGGAFVSFDGIVVDPYENAISRLLTTYGANGVGIGSGIAQYGSAGIHDGMTIYPSAGTISGTVRVYGLQD
jgi:hypothetical protein